LYSEAALVKGSPVVRLVAWLSGQIINRFSILGLKPSMLYSDALQSLSTDQLHYLTKVMRLRDGDVVRVFNAKDGVWGPAVDH
jgi:hypothetical protein